MISLVMTFRLYLELTWLLVKPHVKHYQTVTFSDSTETAADVGRKAPKQIRRLVLPPFYDIGCAQQVLLWPIKVGIFPVLLISDEYWEYGLASQYSKFHRNADDKFFFNFRLKYSDHASKRSSFLQLLHFHRWVPSLKIEEMIVFETV